MTIETTATTFTYSGNGVTIAFDYDAYAQSSAQLKALFRVAGVDTVQTSGFTWTRIGSSPTSKWRATWVTPPPMGTTVVLYLEPSLTQTRNLVSLGTLEQAEDAQDEDRLVDQYLARLVGQSLRARAGETFGEISKAAFAGNFLAFDPSGNPIPSGGVASVAVSAAMTPVVQAVSLDAGWVALGGDERVRDAAGAALVGRGNALVTPSDGTDQIFIDTRHPRNPITDGAVANGVADDRAAIASAQTALGTFGGQLGFGPLSYGVGQDGANLWCVNITQPLSATGFGSIYSAIKPLSGVGSSASVLRYKPGTTISHGFLRLQNLFIGDPTTALRHGGTGVEINLTDAGQVLDRFWIDGVSVQGTSAGALALNVVNDELDNVTGAFFCSVISRSSFNGGMRFFEVGDSLLFNSVTSFGKNAGLDFLGVSGAGGHPSQCILLNYNSTSEGGQAVHRGGHFFALLHSNMEQQVSLSGGRMVDIGTTDLSYCPLVWSSMLGAFAGANLSSHVRMQNAEGGAIAWNAFLIGHPTSAATADIVIETTCDSVWVGPNLTQRAAGLSITDNGIGTRGVTKTPALSNSWVAVGSGADVLQYTKTIDGVVHIWGSCSGGTTTSGTTIFTLPAGFRPSGFVRAVVTVDDGGSFVVPGHLLILSTGEVQIGYVPTGGGAGAQKLFVAISFRAALGNSIVVS